MPTEYIYCVDNIIIIINQDYYDIILLKLSKYGTL